MTPRTGRTRQHRDGCADLATVMAMPDVCVGDDVLRCVASPVFSDFWLFPLLSSSVVVVVVVRLVAPVVVLEASSRVPSDRIARVVKKQLHLCCLVAVAVVVVVVLAVKRPFHFGW